MTDRVVVDGLSVARVLYDFINREVLPGTGVPEAGFWTRLDRIVHDLAPKNRALLAKRDALQAKIDAWHRERKGRPFDLPAYKAFLGEIGYLIPEGPDFAVDTREGRRRDCAHRRAAAGGAGDQRALCAERRQRPLGQPLRRALRHRRDPRGRRRHARRQLQSRARQQGVPVDQAVPGRDRAARPEAPTRRCAAMPCRTAGWW